MSDTNPLDILKRLDVKQNVTIRIIDEPTGKVVQEHIGHNAATNSLLTGIAHYLMGDGVLNQAKDTLSMWVPQYMSLGTMGLTSQDADDNGLPIGVGYTPVAPDSATEEEKELNAQLRFEEYINQAPGFGADGYDANDNNNREWFGLGYPYSDKPNMLSQDFYDAGQDEYVLSKDLISGDKDSIISVTVYPDGIINQDLHNTSITRIVLSVEDYDVSLNDNNEYVVTITNGTSYSGRLAIIYMVDSGEAVNCELITTDVLRSKITYRNIIPEVQSEIPNTLDVIYSAFVSTGALRDYRGGNSYIYITEAGLWSKPYYNNSGDNGLLAAYRIMPTDDEIVDIRIKQEFTGDGTTATFTLENAIAEILSVNVDNVEVADYVVNAATNSITFGEESIPASGSEIVVIYTTTDTSYTWKDMRKPENREAVQKNIIRIGTNQVAQIIWKLQLGGLEQLNGLRYIYPSQYPEEVWEVWQST